MVSTVTSFSGMDPQPRVHVVIDAGDLVAGTATISVLQLSKWGTVVVRDAERRPSTGGFVVTDYELPLGVPITYRVEQFDSAGVSLGFVLDMPAQVDIPFGWVVFSDPLAQDHAVMVRAADGFGNKLSRHRPTEIYRSGSDHTIALSGVRGLLENVDLSCFTTTETEREALETIVGESLVLVRTMPGMRLPGSLYVSVPDTVLDPIDAITYGDWDEWVLTGSQVSRPRIGTIIPSYTWQDVIDYYPTWSALIADRITWFELLRNPPPEV